MKILVFVGTWSGVLAFLDFSDHFSKMEKHQPSLFVNTLNELSSSHKSGSVLLI